MTYYLSAMTLGSKSRTSNLQIGFPNSSDLFVFNLLFLIVCREFVSCVQSIKILSSAEVQQMSLDGDLGSLPVPKQACSGTNSGNAWRGHYDDNSAASFNR